MSLADQGVPGFVLTSGARGTTTGALGLELVSAIEQGTRRRVSLVRLPPLREDERAVLVDVLAAYADVTGEHLATPVTLAEHADVLVVPAAEYVTLDGLADEVRPRSPGQVATVVAPVAAALAALADAGLAHGDVGEHAVSIDVDGRPRLLGAGARSALHALAPREVPEPTQRSDRDDLLAMLDRLADGVDDAGLHALVAALLAEAASPAEVADRLLAEVDPVPLGGPDTSAPGGSRSDDDPSTSSASAGAQRGAGRRRLLWAVVVVVALAAIGVAVGVSTRGGDSGDAATASGGRTDLPAPVEPTVGPTASPAAPVLGTELCGPPAPAPEQSPPLAESWVEVVDELYTRRSAALVTGQTSLLCQVYDPLSPGLASDLELEAAYTEQGVRPDALVFVVEDAALVSQDGVLLTVEITDRLEPYSVLDRNGQVVAGLAGIPSETWQARLVPDPTGTAWRFG